MRRVEFVLQERSRAVEPTRIDHALAENRVRPRGARERIAQDASASVARWAATCAATTPPPPRRQRRSIGRSSSARCVDRRSDRDERSAVANPVTELLPSGLADAVGPRPLLVVPLGISPLTIVSRLVPSGSTIVSYCDGVRRRNPSTRSPVVEAVLLEDPLHPSGGHVVRTTPQADARLRLEPNTSTSTGSSAAATARPVSR